MIILAVDLGKSRTGLAICDKNEILASPIGVIHEKNEKILTEKIKIEVKSNHVELIVLGLPKNMDGSEGESSKHSKRFAEMLKESLDIPVVLWDERRTTISAANILTNLNVFRKKRKNIIDAVSAVIILENYLAYRNNQKF